MANIAISANTSWYLYNFRRNTISALINNGHIVTAISPTDKYSQKIIELGATHIDLYIDQSGKNPIRDFFSYVDFLRIFRVENFDVLLNFTPKNNIYGTLAAKKYDIKVINNISGLGLLFINENFTSKMVRILYKISQKFAHKVFFQNEEDRDLFVSHNIVKFDFTERLPGSGVDLSRFHVSPVDDDGVVKFLLVARMLYNKGVGYYVEAARYLTKKYLGKVEFILLGFLDVNNPSAVSKDQMQSWVDEGIVTYLGTSDNVEKEMSLSDCIVLPSFYREGVPKSLLEGAALGKLIITTDNVGCRETVDHGVSGYLCEPKSTDSLIEMLEKVINLSHEERLAMGLAGRSKVEKEFDEKIVIDKYMSSIEECLSNL